MVQVSLTDLIKVWQIHTKNCKFLCFLTKNLSLFQEHSPPTNLVMKKGGWNISGENVTKLQNKDGEEEANRRSWEQKRQASLYRSGTFGSSASSYDPQDSKSCAIM